MTRLNHAALRVIRERTGRSQTEIATLCGMDRGNYANIEAGRKPASSVKIKQIATALQVPFDALLGPEQVG